MTKLTPMMAQYQKIKAEYKNCILMFRLGDFYEMFFEDAVTAAPILQIALTSRSKDKKQPMCGVPYHAVDQYLAKLTKAGKKVALCDQITEPTGKGIVEREVVRVVTPGTTFDESLLDQRSNNFVAAIAGKEASFGFAYADVTTGDFKVTELSSLKELESEIMRVGPAELIGAEELLKSFKKDQRMVCFDYEYCGEAESYLKAQFQVQSLKVFGLEGRKMASETAAMLLNYLQETQKSELKHIPRVAFYQVAEFMPLDAACIRNLELFFCNCDGKKDGSLIGVLDETICAMGGRMLRSWLRHPLIDRAEVEERLNKVEVFLQDSSLLREIREVLGSIYDVERLISRLSLGTGNARDLLALRQSLEQIPVLKEKIAGIEVLKNVNERLVQLDDLTELLGRSIADEAPMSVREGGMIRGGYHQELDELRNISKQGKSFIKNLQEQEIEKTGISSLKVKFNKVFGYYIEISKTNLDSVPEHYIRKQTLVNAERFIIPELKEYEEKVLSAEDKIKELEYEIFYGVRMKVVEKIVELQSTARGLAEIDVLANFAFIGAKNNYCKPEICDENMLEIKNGRHPVVEQISFGRDFIPNDCKLSDENRFMLITGPNMGGKSTYLRQIALIVLMAQIGSYVPAEAVKMGMVDRIFTRVGASDNLVAGESTFMVEMQEASFILNQASERSLVILDEIGRGTSTYDGLSIAWAITEYLHNEIKAKTLFATHYHELVELVGKLDAAVNFSSAVRENQEEGVVFLYKIIEGGVDKSYGIEVAKLAGLPKEVVGRARGVLKSLEEKGEQAGNGSQMGIFEREHVAVEVTDQKRTSVIEDKLEALDLNNLTPLEALQFLDELKKLNK